VAQGKWVACLLRRFQTDERELYEIGGMKPENSIQPRHLLHAKEPIAVAPYALAGHFVNQDKYGTTHRGFPGRIGRALYVKKKTPAKLDGQAGVGGGGSYV